MSKLTYKDLLEAKKAMDAAHTDAQMLTGEIKPSGIPKYNQIIIVGGVILVSQARWAWIHKTGAESFEEMLDGVEEAIRVKASSFEDIYQLPLPIERKGADNGRE